MAITLWRTRTPFEGLLRWFDDDVLRTGFDRTWTPAIDVEEKDGGYLVKADLPGLKKDDIHIELRNSVLTLRGERRDEHEENKAGFYKVERTFGSFERSLRVPEGVTEKDIHAKYTDGVLELKIPAPAAKEQKALEIKVE
jgi:HSP20 family protein